MRVIDAHTHIFPDQVARKGTMNVVDYFGLPKPPEHFGTLDELIASLDSAGIEYAVVFSAATTPHQVEAVNRYILSETEKYGKLIPCGTLHARYEGFKEELRWMREHGVFGVKIHPELQRFALDDERLFPMFEEMERNDMFLIAHMGDPRGGASGPERLLPVATTFPKLRCVAAHLGNWNDWDAEKIRPAARLENVYTDISSCFSCTENHPPLYDVLNEFDPKHVFFGSDYPIWCPKKELEKALRLHLPGEFLEDILFHNFAAFYHYKTL